MWASGVHLGAVPEEHRADARMLHDDVSNLASLTNEVPEEHRADARMLRCTLRRTVLRKAQRNIRTTLLPFVTERWSV